MPPAAVQGAVARWAARLHGQGCPRSSGGRGSTVPGLQGALSSQVLEAGPRLPPAPGPSARDASLPSLPVILTWPLPRAALHSDSSFSSGDVAGPAPAPRCGFTSPPRALGCCSRSRRPPGLSGALTSGRRLGLSPCVTWCWPTSAERAVGPDQLRWPVLPASWTGHGHARLPHHRQGTRHSRRRQITRDSRRSARGAVLATAPPSGSAGVDAAAVEGDGLARPGLLAEGQTEPWGTDGALGDRRREPWGTALLMETKVFFLLVYLLRIILYSFLSHQVNFQELPPPVTPWQDRVTRH